MTVLDILQDPDPRLRAIAAPVTPVDLRGADMQTLIDDMFDTLRARSLIGMAAPQAGISKRLFVVHFTQDGLEHGPLVVANPRVLQADGDLVWTEASPCKPNQIGEVTRRARIRCRGLDRRGKPFTLKANGLLAVCLQHEIDHLDGILCFDRAEHIRPVDG